MRKYHSWKNLKFGITCAEWEPPINWFDEIIRNSHRWRNSYSTKDSDEKFETLEELVRTGKQGDDANTKKKCSKDVTLPVPLRVRDYLPRDLAAYPVTISQKPANIKCPKGYTECKCDPIWMNNLNDINDAVFLNEFTICEVLSKDMASRNKSTPYG